jgi:hypothetical protein
MIKIEKSISSKDKEETFKTDLRNYKKEDAVLNAKLCD